ncbi:hypothetical protein [Streptomyces sp. Sge12]|nr:hypothetical protein [Streptomyces sp. Sge12]
MSEHLWPTPVDWRKVRQRVRLWLAPALAALYWVGRMIREGFFSRM